MSNSLLSFAARSRRVRCWRRAGIRVWSAVVDTDFDCFAFRVLALFSAGEGAFARIGLGALLLLLGGAMVSLSISVGGCLLWDTALEGGGGGKSGSVLVGSSCCDDAGRAGEGALGGVDSLRLRDALSGVDSSSGRKFSRSSSSMDESDPSINRRMLGCLLRILRGPKIDRSTAGVS
jgi:hypothetical protein